MSKEAETVYERIAHLEEEVASMRAEIDVIKGALRNKIARHEIRQIRGGRDVSSIID